MALAISWFNIEEHLQPFLLPCDWHPLFSPTAHLWCATCSLKTHLAPTYLRFFTLILEGTAPLHQTFIHLGRLCPGLPVFKVFLDPTSHHLRTSRLNCPGSSSVLDSLLPPWQCAVTLLFSMLTFTTRYGSLGFIFHWCSSTVWPRSGLK